MGDPFFESVGVPDSILFSDQGSLNVVHQIGEKIDGGFLNQFALARFVRTFAPTAENNAKVLLVLTHHSKSHWTSISSKLGFNISTMQDKGSLVVIDLLKEAYEITKSRKPVDDIESLFDHENVFRRCEKIVQDFKASGSKRILVILEDLTNFLDIGGSVRESEKHIIELLLMLKALSTSSYENERCSVTINTLVQSPEIASHSVDQSRLAKTVAQNLSTLMFEVSPLSTGFSAQVTGYLKVKCTPQINCNAIGNNEFPFIRNFHFKLDSNNVRATPL